LLTFTHVQVTKYFVGEQVWRDIYEVSLHRTRQSCVGTLHRRNVHQLRWQRLRCDSICNGRRVKGQYVVLHLSACSTAKVGISSPAESDLRRKHRPDALYTKRTGAAPDQPPSIVNDIRHIRRVHPLLRMHFEHFSKDSSEHMS
jgi:hypothetical protein